MFPAFKDRGTLAPGAPADVTLLELREGTFEFLDNYDNRINGRQRMFATTTILAGQRIS
jgi:predicted amidohydrolase